MQLQLRVYGLWKSKLHEWLKFFLWRILSNVMPAKEVLIEKFAEGDISFVVCGEGMENIFHLFKECNDFRVLAFSCNWGSRTNAWPISSIYELIEACLNPPAWACEGYMDKTKSSSFLASLLYCLWGFSNNCMFEGKSSIKERGKLVE